MKQKLLIFLAIPALGMAQTPIFTPSMPIVATDYVDSPAGEGVENIIDGSSATKFLDFGYFDGMGFTVNTGASSIATGIDITTANDSEERDPMDYQIHGSNNGTDFTSIATGTIPCISARFFTRSFSFTNTTAYQHYRIVFFNQCNTIEAMIQLSEVQLTGTILNVSNAPFLNAEVNLYPNPGTGVFYVQTKGGNAISAVSVSDALGKEVKHTAFHSASDTQEIGIQDLSAGMYFVTIESAGVRTTKKLVVN